MSASRTAFESAVIGEKTPLPKTGRAGFDPPSRGGFGGGALRRGNSIAETGSSDWVPLEPSP